MFLQQPPGDPIVRDVNNDKVIDENDRTIIGNAQPDFTFGFTQFISPIRIST